MLPLLVQILAAVLEALGVLAAINGIVQAIRAVLNLGDPGSWANKVLANTATSADLLNDPLLGLGAIHTSLLTLASDINALGAPQQFDQPVVLPTTPPAGYGGTL